MEVAAAETDRNSLAVEKENSGVGGLTKLFKGPQGEDFNVDNNTFSKAQIRATFYAKFENEKSDQEITLIWILWSKYNSRHHPAPRVIQIQQNVLILSDKSLPNSIILVGTRMIEMVSHGQATWEE
ncbi:uncharacterized protein [Elaeis guineensis]|uniref:uncharacterized protein isoform X4 n=1 Tax=Elaeis guineensis var. tenera TaxID=51953 RepID=UPI003C6D8602